VNVRLFVATDASRGLDPEGAACMALFARNRDVQTEKRKFRQVVIEVGDRFPALGQVAIVARRPQSGCVNVACPMTAHTVRRQLAGAEGPGVTGVAIHAGVLSCELPSAIACMVEGGRAPLLCLVAAGAVNPHAPRMNILSLVAADTLLGHLFLHISRTVALLTVQLPVRALQCKSRFPGVIETRGLPAAGGMTTGALRTALAAMYVVRRMAGDA